jgi:hypothetical protein
LAGLKAESRPYPLVGVETLLRLREFRSSTASSLSRVLMRRRLRGRTELLLEWESEERDAGAKADEPRCDKDVVERLGSVMMAAGSATTTEMKARESGCGFASERGFDPRWRERGCCRHATGRCNVCGIKGARRRRNQNQRVRETSKRQRRCGPGTGDG